MNLTVTPQAIAAALRSICLNINYQLELEDAAGAAIAGRAGVEALAELFNDPLAGTGDEPQQVVADAMRLAVTPPITPKPAPEPAPEKPPYATVRRSPDREALLRKLWTNPAYSLRAIREAINDLPGEPFGSDQGIYAWADTLALMKPRPALVPRGERAKAAPPEPEGPFVPNPDDVQEAEGKVRGDPDGWNGRRLADYYGWPLAFAGELAQRVRKEPLGG